MSRPDAPIPREVALRAAEWYLLLHSDEADATSAAACAAWRAQSEVHEHAWQRAQRVSEKLGLIPGALGGQVLKRPVRSERRRAVKTLATLLLAAPAAWTAYRQAPIWTADHRTAVGERRDVALADGTRISLNTDTAIDVVYDDRQRLVVLRAGEILVETAPDPVSGRAARPFLVATDSGLVRAIGTRFIVRREGNISRVGVLAGAVEVMPGESRETSRRIDGGQQVWFSRTETGETTALDPAAGAWRRGVLAADDMRLADFLAELSRHRRGVLRCDPAVADLRISGAFQVGDTDPVLRSLSAVLPVEVVYRTRYWVLVAPRAAG